ncbi:hypothetical protein lbkm_4018 [Lachnospiraceae bacterium KM106-2]|nr:hypothetical protein lbkm_4018 [Lachnospiraceae bacterium KM106-2]
MNSSYLLKEDGLISARKQHGELPKSATDNQIRCKVVCMLIVGVSFFITGMNAYLMKQVEEISFGFVLVCFTIYALIEACYYRYWKVFGEFLLGCILTFIFLK